MPTVLVMMIAGLSLGGAAVTSSIGAQKSSTRDQAAKEALAAADAGVQVALFRQNKVLLSDSLPCVVEGIGGDLFAGSELLDGWCDAFTGTVGDATYTYRVKPATLVGTLQNEKEMRIVSVGTSDGINRRIAVGARSKTGAAIFGEADLVGLDWLDLTGSSTVTGDVGSNGTVTHDSSKLLCGDVTYGYGQSFEQNGPWCAGFGAGEGEFNMPPPLQGTVPPSMGGNNSNGRIWCGRSGVDPTNCDPKSGNITWNSSTRVLSMQGNSTLTLGGSLPYSLCKLDMQGNSTLIAAQGATVKIFFDAPENCGASCPSSYRQVDVRGNAKVYATSNDPKDMSFLFVGSSSCPTNIELSGNAKSINEVVFYGPRTDMTLWGNATLAGAMTGKTVNTGGSAKFIADPEASDFDVEVALQYKRDRYVECVGSSWPTAGNDPDANC